MTHEEFKQALESLQEGLYAKWEANLDEGFIIRHGHKSKEAFLESDLIYRDRLLDAFVWTNSPEGFDYWYDLCYKPIPPIPKLTYWFVSFSHPNGFKSAHVTSNSKYLIVRDMLEHLAEKGYEATVLFYKEISKTEYELNVQANED